MLLFVWWILTGKSPFFPVFAAGVFSKINMKQYLRRLFLFSWVQIPEKRFFEKICCSNL